MGKGMKRIKGIKTGRFVAINANGDLYSTVRCHLESYFSSHVCFSFPLSTGKQRNILIFKSLPSSFLGQYLFASYRHKQASLKEISYSESVNLCISYRRKVKALFLSGQLLSQHSRSYSFYFTDYT